MKSTMRQRNNTNDHTTMRQRPGASSPAKRSSPLEVAQGRPLDDDDNFVTGGDGNEKLLTTKSNRKRQRLRKRDKFLYYWRQLRQFLRGTFAVLQALCQKIWARALKMTAVEIIVTVVSLIFLGFPLLLFIFSEKQVIKEHAIHYDIYNCPDKPPLGYPRSYPMLDVLHHWEIDSLTIPERINKGLCVFDLQQVANNVHQHNNHSHSHHGTHMEDDDVSIRQKIMHYRTEEVPFVIRNDPSVLEVAQRFSDQNYLGTRLANQAFPATLVFVVGNDTTANTKSMTFEEWYGLASNKDNNQQPPDSRPLVQFSSLHLTDANFLQQDLSFFRTHQFAKYHKKNKHAAANEMLLYDIAAGDASTLQCDLASPGFRIEETLQMADGGGSYIAQLQGKSRYLLVHPQQCSTIYLESEKDEEGHYSSRIHLNRYYNMTAYLHRLQRHSSSSSSVHHHYQVHSPQVQEKEFPDFSKTAITEVVLEAGDVLHLPSHWFRYSVTVDDQPSYQCKAHSSAPNVKGQPKQWHKHDAIIQDCLKHVKKQKKKK